MTVPAALAAYGVVVVLVGTTIALLEGRPRVASPRRARGRRD